MEEWEVISGFGDETGNLSASWERWTDKWLDRDLKLQKLPYQGISDYLEFCLSEKFFYYFPGMDKHQITNKPAAVLVAWCLNIQMVWDGNECL